MTSTAVGTQQSMAPPLVNGVSNNSGGGHGRGDGPVVKKTPILPNSLQKTIEDYDDSDIDAEGEEVDDDSLYVGANEVKSTSEVPLPSSLANGGAKTQQSEKKVTEPIKPSRELPDVDEESSEEGSDDDGHSAEEESEGSGDESSKDSSEAESDVEGAWEEASPAANEDEEPAAPNRCIFCGEDEEHDPSEDYEEYLSCAVCGENSHRQCARTAIAFNNEEDASRWRCPTCVENSLEPDEDAEDPRASAPKLAKDLLPATRGAPRPGSHSVFNQLIVNGDPLDGSRLLRKRKTSSEEEDGGRSQPELRKRQKTSEVESESEDASASASGESEDELVSAAAPQPRRSEKLVNGVGTNVASEESESESPASRPSRSRKSRKSENELAYVLRKSSRSLVMAFRLDSGHLSRILAMRSRKKKKKKQDTVDRRQPLNLPPQELSGGFATPFYSFHERENDELKSKPYGGILSEADADTTKTLPQVSDRERFDEAKQKAEEEWRHKAAQVLYGSNEHAAQKIAGPASKMQCISFGGYEIDTWYAAPYPEEYSRNRVLYICEFCLKYMNSDYVAWRHKLKCPAKHPPGDEIYRDGSVSVFEVDGRKNPVYCQNLCLLAKLFLGSKTLYYDVEPFLFYIMTEYDEFGCHFVGYFSKEKRPSSSNNVSCILTLPIHQRKGYGNLLIDFSYLLTRVEGKTGSPEKPLSDMGLVSYRNYWRLVLCYELLEQRGPVSIAELSDRTGMTADDIVSALEGLRALVRDPLTHTYALRLDYDFFKSYIEKWEMKGYVRLNPDGLIWTPYVMGRSNLAHLEHAPPLATVAPREEEGDEDEEKAPQAEEGVQMQTNGVTDPDSQSVGTGEATLMEKKNEVSAQNTNEDFPKFDDVAGPPPRTPLTGVEGQTDDTAASREESASPPIPDIPANRFEIFPPLPGSIKKKSGRGPGPGRGRKGPIMREYSRDSPATTGTQPSSKKKLLFKRSTRSSLHGASEEVAVGDVEDSATDAPDAEDEGLKGEV